MYDGYQGKHVKRSTVYSRGSDNDKDWSLGGR